MKIAAYVIANFGGPRTLKEIKPFLESLLCDQEVLRTGLPRFLHVPLFKYVAAKRTKKVALDYKEIGGNSPIYNDTEAIATELRQKLNAPVLTFHRYLPSTHDAFFEQMKQLPCGEIRIFPMFPQFTYATTGSIATLFKKKLPKQVELKLRWIKSYPTHPAYINVMQTMIKEYLVEKGLQEQETILLFSAHGLPQKFIQTGDIYLSECQASFDAIMKAFPGALGRLCFQSKFGPGEWIRPYTIDCSEQIKSWAQGRKQVVFVPVAFTSDHIETLFEIEQEYLPPIQENGLDAYRLPAMNQRKDWIDAITQILKDQTPVTNQMLTR